MLKGLGLPFVAAGLVLALAAPASASSDIYVDNVALAFYPPAGTVDLTGSIDGSSNYNTSNQLAGQILLTVNNGSSSLPAASQYVLPVWCVDIFHDIQIGGSGYVFSKGSLGTDNSLNPSPLSATQIADIEALATYGNHLMRTSATLFNSIVVQAAIWTVEYNSSAFSGVPGVNNSLTVTSTANLFSASDITTMIAAAIKWGGGGGQLISLNSIQQQVFDTPEPASLVLLGAGLLGIAALRRHRI